MKATEEYLPVVLFLSLYSVALTFHSNESHRAVRSRSADCCTMHFKSVDETLTIQMKATA